MGSGGDYEHHIGIIKSSLKKTLDKVKISYVEMCTVISEVEGNMNNRPRTYLTILQGKTCALLDYYLVGFLIFPEIS